MFTKDLEIFSGLEEGGFYYFKIKQNSHRIWILKLKECLSYPTTNIEDLKRRQQLVKRIKALPENELNGYRKKLERLRELESGYYMASQT